jgi:hypothetical protein
MLLEDRMFYQTVTRRRMIMTIENNSQSALQNDQAAVASRVDPDFTLEQWNNWRWHIRHTVTSIPALEHLLGIDLGKEKISQLEQTLERFPMRITPYYLSLIDSDNYENDPIFLQSVPSIAELNLENYDIGRIAEEDKDNLHACLRIDILTESFSIFPIHVLCTAATVHASVKLVTSTRYSLETILRKVSIILRARRLYVMYCFQAEILFFSLMTFLTGYLVKSR